MRRLLASALFAVAGFFATGASAGGLLSDHKARACEDPYVLNMIYERFRHQAFNLHHDADLRILDLTGIHEHEYQPFGEDRPIARRYCGGKVALSDGRRRTIWYLIEDGMGFVGLGDNVEFCISGLDRWLVYNGRCRVLRPGFL